MKKRQDVSSAAFSIKIDYNLLISEKKMLPLQVEQ
jgi:hypothetical protein